MHLGVGLTEFFVVVAAFFTFVVNFGLPVAALVLLVLILRKLQKIEEKLGKP